LGQSTPFLYNTTASSMPEAQDQHIENIKDMLELPEEAAFCGYLIHRNEEYLGEALDSQDQTSRAFVPAPQLAQQFKSYDEASKLARSEHGETVAVMFVLDGDVIVAGMECEIEIETLH